MHPTQGDDLPARPMADTGLIPPVDNHLYAAFGPHRIEVGNNLDGAVVQALMARDGLLDELFRSVRKRYLDKLGEDHSHLEDGGLSGPPIDEVVALLHRDRLAQAKLRQLVGDDNLDLPLPQAAALVRFLGAYPEFWPRLQSKTTRVVFRSSAADNRGGSLFDGGVIHISDLPGTHPAAFVRLLVHEAGHALFEPLLLGGRRLPLKLLRGPETGTFEPLPGGLFQVSPHADREVRDYWAGMPEPSKVLYSAWLTLREEKGRFLLGLDLWEDKARFPNRLGPEQRRKYQAGQFDEFCAELFMQYAMGDLHTHYAKILAFEWPDAVKTAWRLAWTVLDKLVPPILGPRVP